MVRDDPWMVSPWPRRMTVQRTADAPLSAANGHLGIAPAAKNCIRGIAEGRPPGLAGGLRRKVRGEMRAMRGDMRGAVQDEPSTCVNCMHAGEGVPLGPLRSSFECDYSLHI